MKKVPNSIYNYIIRGYNKILALPLGFISDLDITEETALYSITQLQWETNIDQFNRK